MAETHLNHSLRRLETAESGQAMALSDTMG